MQGYDGALLDETHVALADGAHGKFRMRRYAELAHEHDVERDTERQCDLGGHGHTAARHTNRYRVLHYTVAHYTVGCRHVAESRGKLLAGVDSISKSHWHPLCEGSSLARVSVALDRRAADDSDCAGSGWTVPVVRLV